MCVHVCVPMLTRCAPLAVVLLPGPGHLEQGEEAEGVPVQVIVGVELRLLLGWGVARGEGETQVVAHLHTNRSGRRGVIGEGVEERKTVLRNDLPQGVNSELL